MPDYQPQLFGCSCVKEKSITLKPVAHAPTVAENQVDPVKETAN
jgi:hypothetical protein